MSTGDLAVRAMVPRDWSQVEAIYAAGIATGHATFETAPPTWEVFDASRLPGHRLVAVAGDTVVGWAACVPTSSRPVYAGVVEHSIYVHPDAQRRGIGHLLLTELIASTEAAGIWTIQSSLFAENQASMRLHLAHGFRVVGVRERIAKSSIGPHAGQWRTTTLIERRSPSV